MQSLIIRADASTQIGAGHLMRCLALAQAWKDAGGAVTFITACRSEGLIQRLRDEKLDIRLLSNAYPDTADWNFARDILASHPGAWVVLDGYHFDEVYQRQVRDAGNRLLVIDDRAHLKHYYGDIVLNQNLHAEQLRYACEPYTRLLLGTRYVLLRREFLAWREWQSEISAVARRVLVTLGGSDPLNHTPKIIQVLHEVGIPDMEVTVVIGAGNPHTGLVEQEVKRSSIPIRLMKNAENMPELMAWADVAFSGLGVTCWELAYMGCPMLVVRTARGQEINTSALWKSGIALEFDLKDRVPSPMANEMLQNLLDSQQARTDMSRMGRKVVDGFGASRAVHVIMA